MQESSNDSVSGAAVNDDGTGSTGSSKPQTRILHSQNQTDDVTPDQRWRGCSMEEIYRGLNEFELEHVPAVLPSLAHTVLHHYPIRVPDSEPPRPLRAHPKWDALHVRLPCSSKSQYPVTEADGSARIESRWEMIERALLRPITNSLELQAAILTYNSKYEDQWNFRALHKLFDEELDESEARVFFEDLLPRIIRLALRLPELVQAPIPLLKQGQNHSITLTQQQVSCLLANAFLCTFPRRNTLKRKSEYSNFPDINFNRLYQSQGNSVIEKLKCICHYFRRVCPTERDASNVPTGVVTFTRRSLSADELPDWSECEAPLGATPLHITSEGTIEDDGYGLLQVDFANKFLGGGVLGFGCVQEEIRFVICPELLISKLFTECLRPTEALTIVGCERYSNYSGYASTFQWDSNHEDCTPHDSSRRRLTHIVAIDALRFQMKAHQYREELMLRELNKAYVGFLHPLRTPAPGVASGNWGCGAFGGDATLKALLQLIVCTLVGRPLVYFTFGNATLRDDVHSMHNFFIEKDVRVKDLWSVLRRFQAQKLPARQLYEYIYNELKCSTNRKTSQTSANGSCGAAKMPDNNATKASGSSCSSSSGVKKPTSVAHDSSPDIFLDWSSESSEMNDVHIKDVVLISDNDGDDNDDDDGDNDIEEVRGLSEDLNEAATNAKLLAAAVRAEERAKATHSSPTHTASVPASAGGPNAASGSTMGTPSKSLRQRTLLEMLDQCYTEGVSSKRRCQSKPDGGN